MTAADSPAPPLCGVMIYPARIYIDPEPPEYCGEELYENGECPVHGWREENQYVDNID